MNKKKTALITGISGQDGAYLSKYLLEKNYDVIGITRSYSSNTTLKLRKLGIENQIKIEECDLLDYASLLNLLLNKKPDEIYNLAAQSSVGLSFNQPIGTIQFNTISVLNLLEIIRQFLPNTKFYQASSSEMFGNVAHLPINEDTVLNPSSPYAISKASSHMMVKLYRESYHVFSCSGILFNHESVLRDENFFVKKLINGAVRIKKGLQENLVLGNLDIKRDFGNSIEYVKAMHMMLQADKPNDFIICSGKSIYLRDIVDFVFDYLQIDKNKIIIDKSFFRPSEIIDIYGSNQKAKNLLNWDYDNDFNSVLKLMIEDCMNEIN
jgi:GDPmannose 4,6-dehydratase